MAGGAGSIGELLAALRRIGERLDMKVSVDVSKYPEVKFRSPFESGNGTMRIKIEVKVNTYERSPTHLRQAALPIRPKLRPSYIRSCFDIYSVM